MSLYSALTAFTIYGFFFFSSQQLRRDLIITCEWEETPLRRILQLAGARDAAVAFPMRCLKPAYGLALAVRVNTLSGL